jgi:hypothetical protein
MKYKYFITLCISIFYLNAFSMEHATVGQEYSDEDMPRGMNWGMVTFFDEPKETKSMKKSSHFWKEKNAIIKDKNSEIEDFYNATNKFAKHWNDDKELNRCVKDVYKDYRKITIEFQTLDYPPIESKGMEEIYDEVNEGELCQTDFNLMNEKEKNLCYNLRLYSSQAQNSIIQCWDNHLKRMKNGYRKEKSPIQTPVCPKKLSFNQLNNLSDGAYLPIEGGFLWANQVERMKITNNIIDVRGSFSILPITNAILQELELNCTYSYKGTYNKGPVFIKIDLYDTESNRINESEETKNTEQEINMPPPLLPKRNKQPQGEEEEDSNSFVSTLSSSSSEEK